MENLDFLIVLVNFCPGYMYSKIEQIYEEIFWEPGALTCPDYMGRWTLVLAHGSLDIVPSLSLHLPLPPFLWKENVILLSCADHVLRQSSPRGHRLRVQMDSLPDSQTRACLIHPPVGHHHPHLQNFPLSAGNKQGKRISETKIRILLHTATKYFTILIKLFSSGDISGQRCQFPTSYFRLNPDEHTSGQ